MDQLAKISRLYESGNYADAESACTDALLLEPGSAGLHNLRGDILQAQHRYKDAFIAYGRAIKCDERCFPAWYSAGCALMSLTEYAGALPCFEKAVALEPKHVQSHHNLGRAQYLLGRIDEAIAHFRSAEMLDDNFLSSTAIAVSIPGSPSATHADVLKTRKEWAGKFLPARTERQWPAREPGPLRVGYVSSFFESRNWMKAVWGLINEHDRGEIAVSLFSDAPEAQCVGYRRHEADRFVDISALSNEEAAKRIEESRLDLLIDLNSFSRVERLPLIALRPAPVIAAWFNLYATSGISAYDYLIGDDQVIRPEEEEFYVERIARVPGSYLTFDVQYSVPDVAPPPCSFNGYVTFGCLASLYKLTPRVIEAWSEVLKKVPTARLFLKNGVLDRPGNRQTIAESFGEHGVDPGRIDMEGRSPHDEFLAAYSKVDLALDPFPYNGGTTTSEALWQGVPVLTLDGDRWAARQGASLLRAARLEEFIAPDLSSYIANAVAMAADPGIGSRLEKLRAQMRAHLRASAVCDTRTFARNMETLYRRLAG